MYKILLGRFRAALLLARACTKSGWLEVDQELDMGWPTFVTNIQERKSSLNIKFLGGTFLGHPGPRRRDIPDKNFMQVAFYCCFRQGVAGMSPDLGRDVPDLEKLYAGKLWADFSHPKHFHVEIAGVFLAVFLWQHPKQAGRVATLSKITEAHAHTSWLPLQSHLGVERPCV